ncbi:hypothetical protein [Mycolicibacterium conceptionense]|uniref:hypothetical protein n=1 Tax=Mycolicibacterium conceptionense TaxID=451644 RepID=UPI00066217AE|nr:hypothetical protein [Mycolicibacterium conceptionense]
MIGEFYWATGITMRYRADRGWAASIEFLDNGIGLDDGVSTEGDFRTRYYLDSPVEAAQALVTDAKRLGIRLTCPRGTPKVYLHRDNWLSPNSEKGDPVVEQALDDVAEALGWER